MGSESSATPCAAAATDQLPDIQVYDWRRAADSELWSRCSMGTHAVPRGIGLGVKSTTFRAMPSRAVPALANEVVPASMLMAIPAGRLNRHRWFPSGRPQPPRLVQREHSRGSMSRWLKVRLVCRSSRLNTALTRCRMRIRAGNQGPTAKIRAAHSVRDQQTNCGYSWRNQWVDALCCSGSEWEG